MSRMWSTIYSKLFSNISNNLTKILLHRNNYLVFSQTRLNNDSFLIAKKSFNATNVWLLLLVVYFIIVSMSLLVWSKSLWETYELLISSETPVVHEIGAHFDEITYV